MRKSRAITGVKERTWTGKGGDVSALPKRSEVALVVMKKEEDKKRERSEETTLARLSGKGWAWDHRVLHKGRGGRSQAAEGNKA